MAFRAAANNPYLDNIRAEVAANVISLLNRAKDLPNRETCALSEAEFRVIAKIADSVAILRTPVPQDRLGNILSWPDPEVGTELAQGFSRVARGLLCVGIRDWQPHIRRLGRDSIPSMRVRLLQSLERKPHTVAELVQATGVPDRTVRYHLEHLELLGAVSNNNGRYEVLIALP
jgi:DNA-binding transcriptional ArsR family regulator